LKQKDKQLDQPDDEEDQGELLTITVEIGEGRKENIIVFPDDNAADLAEEFCLKHNLGDKLKEVLYVHIQNNIDQVKEENEQEREIERSPEGSKIYSTNTTHNSLYALNSAQKDQEEKSGEMSKQHSKENTENPQNIDEILERAQNLAKIIKIGDSQASHRKQTQKTRKKKRKQKTENFTLLLRTLASFPLM
jgi:hypothetical protein